MARGNKARSASLKQAGLRMFRSVNATIEAADDAAAVFDQLATKFSALKRIAAKLNETLPDDSEGEDDEETK